MILTASMTNTDETAPRHLGSLSGKSWPMSGSPNAPRIASTTQCRSTSPTQPSDQLTLKTRSTLMISVGLIYVVISGCRANSTYTTL